MIHISNDKKMFHIQTENTSYIMGVLDSGHLGHYYYGPLLKHRDNLSNFDRPRPLDLGCMTSYSDKDTAFSLDLVCREEGTPGKGDYRRPSLIMQDMDNGDSTFDFHFHSCSLSEEKPALKALPSALTAEDKDSQSLTIILKDLSREIYLHLKYSSFPASDSITRSLEIENKQKTALELDRVMSLNLDMNLPEMDLITLDGAWIREREENRRPLGQGVNEIGSRRGVSSSDHNPFIALAEKHCTEDQGQCFGFALIYSGNHSCMAELSPHDFTRVQLGIQSETFRWILEGGESFQSPEAVMSYTQDGLSSLSRNFHSFVQKHIVRGEWQYKERPILINNWEATYFNFNEKKLLSLAKEAAGLGIELFVLDDGWFGKRNDDKSSLGDWQVNLKKLPGGLKKLQEKISKLGLDFGLWVEPEMISVDSELYRAHPDWMVRSPLQEPSPGRNQFLLDLTREEVRDYLVTSLSAVFSSADISYIKWDMNRNFSDIYSNALPREKQQEFCHRYVLGLYDILDRLTKAFPKILFESCASGGNRFDMGMLCYMPQTWTSDDTDAVERLSIQHGTSFFAPPSTMGAHVSAAPNHQTLRETSLESRYNTAAFGVLGYELDLTKLSSFDRKVIKKQVSFYKEHRALIQFGNFRRVRKSADGKEYLWMVVNEDGSEALAGWYKVLARANRLIKCLPFPGLERDAEYCVKNRIQYENIRRFGELINEALPIDLKEGGFVLNKIADTYMYKLEEDEVHAGGDLLSGRGYLPRPEFYGTGMEEGVIFLGDFGSRIFHIQKKL